MTKGRGADAATLIDRAFVNAGDVQDGKVLVNGDPVAAGFAIGVTELHR